MRLSSIAVASVIAAASSTFGCASSPDDNFAETGTSGAPVRGAGTHPGTIAAEETKGMVDEGHVEEPRGLPAVVVPGVAICGFFGCSPTPTPGTACGFHGCSPVPVHGPCGFHGCGGGDSDVATSRR